ncbi:dermonecrotic toxin domain-containing protein [Xanthomonas sp. NCPPB 2632]|uniref:dermonecrotic toxin domain-containing protein n=1 Tax=Xanthomonas sp. NCPPB 2632 TaxID=3240912 RepID=UPI0035139AF3
MDMTPPQAPPAIVSDTQQEAIDGLQRLLDVQGWLTRQQATIPAVPSDPRSGSRDTYLAELAAWWQQPIDDAPGMPRVSRTAALATRLASTMRDDALVGRIDGTLDTDAATLATRFARSAGGDLPPDMEARSLRVGEVDYAGAVIVVSRSQPSPVLLFMPDHGWETFPDLDTLHARTERRLREVMAQRDVLAGVRADDAQQVVATARFVDSEAMHGQAFDVMARRIVELQAQKLTDAWPAEGAVDASRFADDAAAALDLHDLPDIFALLGSREARLTSAAAEARLARVPAGVAQVWRHAVADYRLAGLLAVASARHHPGDMPLDLAGWSRRELVAALSRRQSTIDPDDIVIEVTGTEALSLPTSTASAPALRLSLAEFALRNTGLFDGRRLRVTGPAGATPDAQTVRELARELDLAPRFAAYLRERLGDPHGRPYRTAAMRLQYARMRIEAADARLSSYLPDEPAVFLDDHEDRGYRLVEAVLDGPTQAGRRTIGGHRVTVRQLVYQGAVVSDVLVIGVRDPRSTSRVVLYTPGAPDGRAYREFTDRATAARQFLYAPAFEDYLLQRLPAELGESRPNGSGRRFRVSEATARAHWVLSAPGDGRGTLTEGPFTEQLVDGDVRTALFDAEIVRQARDVAWAGRSTAHADVESITGILGVALGGHRGPASAIEDTVGAVGQALRSTWRFYDSVKAGDQPQAFLDFTQAYTASLGLLGLHGSVPAGSKALLSLRRGGSQGRIQPSRLRITDAHHGLDPRYATRHADLGAIRPDAAGIYRLDGRRYLRQQGHVFEIRHDAALDSWRLVRPNALDAAFSGPAVAPGASGSWRLRTDIGLRGGWVEHGAFPQPATRGIANAELDGLTAFQRWTFEQAFRRRLHNAAEANLLFWDVTAVPTPRFVTMRQRTAWNDALREARATPSQPLPHGPHRLPARHGGSWPPRNGRPPYGTRIIRATGCWRWERMARSCCRSSRCPARA